MIPLLQITVKYFNIQTAVVQCKIIQSKTFAQLLVANLAKC